MRLLALVLLTTLCVSSFAQAPAAKPGADLSGGDTPERGWFFFKDPPKPKEPPPAASAPTPVPPTTPAPESKEERCKKKDSWSADCGFIDPGEDFAFQAKQRDALFERMVVAKNNPQAVEAVQYYMRWVLNRSSEVASLWWYNMVQNPELDSSVQSPVSAFGLRLMGDVKKNNAKEIFGLLREEGAFFVYFSRTDCAFCHQMADPLRILKQNTGLPIRNASLDARCMPNYDDGCMTSPETEKAAAALQVSTVPALFLYVPSNTWLRVATGVADTQSMEQRTIQFFSAYRNALLKGVDNGANGRVSVDFSGIDPTGVAAGVTKPDAKGMRPPTESEVSQMLGAGKR